MLVVGCGRLDFGDLRAADAMPATAGDGNLGDGDASIGSPLGALANDCVLYLSMDEPAWTGAAGEVHDACAGNDGTTVGGITTVANGTRGRAGLFNGVGCIEIADAPNLRASTALTMSAWLEPTGDPSSSFGVISKRTDYDVDVAYTLFLWTANQMYVDIDTVNDRFADGQTFANATWNQITVVYDGTLPMASRVAVYVNGALDQTDAETSATIPAYTSPLDIGCLPLGSPAQQFVGELDDVAIWTRPLSATEAADWYALTKP